MDRDTQLQAAEKALSKLRAVTDGYRVLVERSHQAEASDAFVALVAFAGETVSRSLATAHALIDVAIDGVPPIDGESNIDVGDDGGGDGTIEA